ncbi:hypothetical protein ANO11243_089680 [Dothideomycetidae sp. 11243]|nr:hypothetical protein ANO11243_089680 [fungal sp. No.11243]
MTLPKFVFEQPAVSILLPLVLGSAVGWSTRRTCASARETQRTYMALKQPPLRPPPWIFGPVWSALYAGMGYAAYRAWTVGVNTLDPRKAMLAQEGATLYTIQLGLNLVWMPLFFGYKRPIAATVDIVALTGVVGYLAYVWSQVDEVAGWCMAPYLAWLGFATYLCAGAGYLNGWDFTDKTKPMSRKKGDTTFVDEKES